MNILIKKLRWIYISFLLWIIISVPIDTYILGGKIKLWVIAVANTTDASPYSTDGQMNIIIVIVAICAIVFAIHYLFSGKNDNDNGDDEDEGDNK